VRLLALGLVVGAAATCAAGPCTLGVADSTEREAEDGADRASGDERARTEELLRSLASAATADEERRAAAALVRWLERPRPDHPEGYRVRVTSRAVPGRVLGASDLRALAGRATAPRVEVAVPYFPPRTPWVVLDPRSPATLAQLAPVALEE